MTCGTESHRLWVYRINMHVVFIDRNAELELEKIRFPNVSSFFDFLSRGAVGKALGFRRAVDICTTKLSGVGCLVKNSGSPWAGRCLREMGLVTVAPCRA